MRNCLAKIAEFHKTPSRIRDEAIVRSIEKELEDAGPIFKSIQTNPLIHEQQLTVIYDEDALLNPK